jgi:hypothetical protein
MQSLLRDIYEAPRHLTPLPYAIAIETLFEHNGGNADFARGQGESLS